VPSPIDEIRPEASKPYPTMPFMVVPTRKVRFVQRSMSS
jgi:hypothetical protein